jgi:hypothetical protein
MVLSETFRLWLFLVVRGGIQFYQETWCLSTGLTGFWILTLEPERLDDGHRHNESKERTASGQTLKLLVSNIRRRNGLLSSKPAE